VAFGTAAVLLPFVLLALVEGAMRLAGLGGYPPILLDVGSDGGRHWYATHRPGTDTFFDPRSRLTGGMRELHFVTPKPEGTVRIVLLGGSAAQGFPQLLPLTDGELLAAMLRDVWAGRRVEVLNLAATAVASFPVRCIAEAALAHEPDLLVVMSGNNEFYGAYGVASLHTAGRSATAMRLVRWLRSLAIVQWAVRLRPDRPEGHGKLMEQVAAKQRIAPGDPARAAAAASLRADLRDIVRGGRDAGVPVVLCTLPTNERGLAPIGVDAPAPEAVRDAFDAALAGARERLADDPEAAIRMAREAVRLHGEHAGARFVLGRALAAAGRDAAAAAEYVAARDLDPMPWRATTPLQDAVRAVAKESGAVLCDVEAAFRVRSPGGATGWELLDDHVHLSLAGQAAFARSLLRTLQEMDGPLRVDPDAVEALPPWEEYARRVGWSVYTNHVAATRIRALLGIPFFRRNNEAAYERADARCREQLASMSELDRRAVERWRDPALHGATDRPLTSVVGVYRMEAGDWAAAAPLFANARLCVPTVSLWRLEANWNLLTCRRHLLEKPTRDDRLLANETVEIGRVLRRFGGAGRPEVERFVGLAENLLGDHAAAAAALETAMAETRGDPEWDVVRTLADSYVQLGRKDDARRVLTAAARREETAAAARELLDALE
jgi:tetratricopeptide (TPR) repeat protein